MSRIGIVILAGAFMLAGGFAGRTAGAGAAAGPGTAASSVSRPAVPKRVPSSLRARAAEPVPIAGDANVDGIVDARDVTAVVDAILQTRLLSIQGFRNADLDQDGLITVLDIARIVRLYPRLARQ